MKKAFLKKVMAVAVVGAMTMGLVACGNGNKRRRISGRLFFKLYGFYNEADGRLF